MSTAQKRSTAQTLYILHGSRNQAAIREIPGRKERTGTTSGGALSADACCSMLPVTNAVSRARGGVASTPFVPTPTTPLHLLDEDDYLQLLQMEDFWLDEEMCKKLQKSPPQVRV